MIKIEKTSVYGFEEAIRGMRNPLNSWEKSDAHECNHCEAECNINYSYCIGKNNFNLMCKLVNAGSDHSKFMRMIVVYVDITAPLYWWKEYDTYKVGTVTNSCSTMHTIEKKKFDFSDFSYENIKFDDYSMAVLGDIIVNLNYNRDAYNKTMDKRYWYNMIQSLPSSYNQKRTCMLNYAVLRNMYCSRKNHKLDEWHKFCEWVNNLPYSNLIMEGN